MVKKINNRPYIKLMPKKLKITSERFPDWLIQLPKKVEIFIILLKKDLNLSISNFFQVNEVPSNLID